MSQKCCTSVVVVQFLTDRRDVKQGIFGFHHKNILPCIVNFESLAGQKSKRFHPKLLEQRLTMYVYMGNIKWCMMGCASRLLKFN